MQRVHTQQLDTYRGFRSHGGTLSSHPNDCRSSMGKPMENGDVWGIHMLRTPPCNVKPGSINHSSTKTRATRGSTSQWSFHLIILHGTPPVQPPFGGCSSRFDMNKSLKGTPSPDDPSPSTYSRLCAYRPEARWMRPYGAHDPLRSRERICSDPW